MKAIGSVAAASGESASGRLTTSDAGTSTCDASDAGAAAITVSPTSKFDDAAADSSNHAGTFVTKWPRITRIHPEHVEHIAKVQAGGLHFDPDLVGCRV